MPVKLTWVVSGSPIGEEAGYTTRYYLVNYYLLQVLNGAFPALYTLTRDPLIS